ncbi:hypothetical protein KSP40_PGU011664 [Platanthera guangdongensis]|uniref:HMA domain-containing protein n=1 Tax=Platanthera guangdongensis TaxID=2320717 RepID=A0ABR2LFI9_9ASPA
MAEKGKISTLVLTVDLECYICSRKIRKTIFKLQGRESIHTVNYEEKSNRVTISGPFDPQRLKKKLLCKAGKVIKEIKVKEEEKKPPPPATKDQTKPAEPEKPKPAPEPEKVKPKDPENKPKEKDREKTKPAEPEKPNKPAEPEKPKPKEPEPEPNKPVAPDYGQPFWPSGRVGPAVPSCCWLPCHVEYYGGCRCSTCGMFFDWTAAPLLPAGGYRGGSSTYQFFCEEDPSCTLM